jgi:hypothetical protein
VRGSGIVLGLLRPVAAIGAVALAVTACAAIAGCHANEPSGQPIDACARSCESRASRQCSSAECARGCEFILDRLIEKETDNVLACVARATRRCEDAVWAECAARVGVHADGGPPAPPPPEEDWE